MVIQIVIASKKTFTESIASYLSRVVSKDVNKPKFNLNLVPTFTQTMFYRYKQILFLILALHLLYDKLSFFASHFESTIHMIVKTLSLCQKSCKYCDEFSVIVHWDFGYPDPVSL